MTEEPDGIDSAELIAALPLARERARKLLPEILEMARVTPINLSADPPASDVVARLHALAQMAELRDDVLVADVADAAAAEIERLRAALRALFDVQNGPPTWKDEAEWDAAMVAAAELLTTT